jgi:hypothetical protein
MLHRSERKLPDLPLPLGGTAFVDIRATRIDRDGDRHVFDRELEAIYEFTVEDMPRSSKATQRDARIAFDTR